MNKPLFLAVVGTLMSIAAFLVAVALIPSGRAGEGEMLAEAVIPDTPKKSRGHLANKAGQSIETIDFSELENWFWKHSDFKIEMTIRYGNQVVIIFSEAKGEP